MTPSKHEAHKLQTYSPGRATNHPAVKGEYLIPRLSNIFPKGNLEISLEREKSPNLIFPRNIVYCFGMSAAVTRANVAKTNERTNAFPLRWKRVRTVHPIFHRAAKFRKWREIKKRKKGRERERNASCNCLSFASSEMTRQVP